MLKSSVHCTLPLVSNPCAPYGAQGLDSSILIWHRDRSQLMDRFMNAFQTPISVVDWSLDGSGFTTDDGICCSEGKGEFR